MQQPYFKDTLDNTRIEKSERLNRLKQNLSTLQDGHLSRNDFNATMAAAQALVMQIAES